MMGKLFLGVSDPALQALRTNAALPSAADNALREFTLAVYNSRGWIGDDQIQAFLDAGFTRQQALDVVTNISAKIMTNLTNQIARTPVDKAFKPLTKGLPYAENRSLTTNK